MDRLILEIDGDKVVIEKNPPMNTDGVVLTFPRDVDYVIFQYEKVEDIPKEVLWRLGDLGFEIKNL